MKNYNPINVPKVEIVHIVNGKVVKNNFVAETLVESTLKDCNLNAKSGYWKRAK